LTTGIILRIILVTVLGSLTDPFQYAFMQRALAEVLLLAVPAGLLGAWIVLRRLAFLTHAVGAATFPGLVLGYGIGFSPWLGAFGMAAGFAGLQVGIERRTRLDPGAVTGILLATALAAGSVLVSDVYHSSAAVDSLLFGSLLGIGTADLVRTAFLDAACVVLLVSAGRGLLATSYAPAAAAALGFRRGLYDAMLLLLLGAAVVTSAATIGGLAVSGLLVVPAATARLVSGSVRELQLVAMVLAAVEGTAGLVMAFELDVPPGAAIAVLAAAVFLAVSLAVLPSRRTPAAAEAAA
jgi:ABC-type Mn2+/Zn2+ transport system permease subunit